MKLLKKADGNKRDLKVQFQKYQALGIPITREGRRVIIVDPEGVEMVDCPMDHSFELLTSTGFRIHAGKLLAEAAGSHFLADGDGSEGQWEKGPHKFIGNGFYLESSGFHYEVEVKAGTIPWKEEWYFAKWPTQKELLESQNHLIQSYESTVRLLAYLDGKKISGSLRERKVLLGPLTMHFDGQILRVKSKGADLAASLTALSGLVDFVTPPKRTSTAPAAVTPMEVEIELG